MNAKLLAVAAWALYVLLLGAPCLATTKGLNQIVTPDIQPRGVLSTSLQGQNRALGNPEQLQLELGLTKSFEIAVFKGFDPGDTVVGAELGLVNTPSFLLSAGLLGVQNQLKTQPYIEGGYYHGKGFVIAGIQHQNGINVGVFGAAYQTTPKILITSDYISSSENFATAGVTLTLSPTVTFNPAVYISNSAPHRAFGYGVVTWNIKLWK